MPEKLMVTLPRIFAKKQECKNPVNAIPTRPLKLTADQEVSFSRAHLGKYKRQGSNGFTSGGKLFPCQLPPRLQL